MPVARRIAAAVTTVALAALVAAAPSVTTPAPHRAAPTVAAAHAAAVAATARPAGSASSYRFLYPNQPRRGAFARWNPCQPINYRVNATLGGPGALADTKAAVARVSAATGIKFVYRGTSRQVPSLDTFYPRGTDLVIAWSRPGSSYFLPRGSRVAGAAGALDIYPAWTAKGVAAERLASAGMVLNANYRYAPGFGTGPRSGLQGTRGQLLMHELGHVVGLDHVSSRSQVMYPTITAKRATWGAGDRAGLRKLGRAAGCLYPTKPTRR